MSNPATRIAEYVLQNLAHEPIAKRIALKRDLAAIAPTNKSRRDLLALAKDLEAIERRHKQLLIDFGLGES